MLSEQEEKSPARSVISSGNGYARESMRAKLVMKGPGILKPRLPRESTAWNGQIRLKEERKTALAAKRELMAEDQWLKMGQADESDSDDEKEEAEDN